MSAHEKFNPAALKTPAGVKELMGASTSEREWNENCDMIKKANNGDYPGFWFQEVMMSGLASRTQAKWSR